MEEVPRNAVRDVPKALPGPAHSEAFLAELSRHHGQLFAFIHALVHNIHDAEDLYQKTSLVLWRKFGEFEPGSDFIAWACRTARFEVLNFLRVRGRDRHVFSEALVAELAAGMRSSSDGAGPRREALAGCLEKLSATDRQLIEACYQTNQTIKQAAAAAGRPVGSVYDSLSRIRRLLFGCVQRTLAAESGNQSRTAN